MNFYKRYPADYQRKTARLTLAQHGAYTLLLDEVYTTEAPLPAELEELFRICRAMSKPEQDAVRTVADRFFPIGEDGLRHNSRADEELVEAAPAVQAARENGRKGGRPKKPRENPAGNPLGFENKTQTKPSSKAPQNSELREEKSRGTSTVAARDALDVDGHEPTAAGLACRRMREAGVSDTNPGDPRLLALLQQGATLEEFTGIAAEAVKREIAKPFPWVLKTLEGRRAEAHRISLAPKTAAPATDTESRNAEARRLLGFDNPTPEGIANA